MAAIALPSLRHRSPPVYKSSTNPNSPPVKSTLPRKPLRTNSLSQQIRHLCQSGNLREALNSLQLQYEVVTPTGFAQVAEGTGILLQACGDDKDIEVGRETHEFISSSPNLRNEFVLNNQIITMYSMCGFPSDSRLVFDELRTKNLYQWNALISGYTRNQLWSDAMSVFCELLWVGELLPDNFTLPCVIKACVGMFDLGQGLVVHGMAVKMGLVSDVFMGNALIAMYGKFGLVGDAVQVFEHMPDRNLVSWNSLLSGFSDNGLSRECFKLFMEILGGEEGLIPDDVTVVTVLPVCATKGEIILGRTVHALAVKLGLDQELKVKNALMDMYLKCGLLPEAEILFGKNIGNRNVVSWNSIIGGYSRVGNVLQTFELLGKMRMDDVEPDKVTILNVLRVCSDRSKSLRLKELHGYSIRHKFQCDELLANGFISAYAKCGSVNSAENVFYGVNNKTASTWNALISGYAQNGEPSKAVDLYLQMTSSGLDPDPYTIGSLLFACAELKSLPSGKQVHGFVLRNGLETDSSVSISLLSFYISCEKPLPAATLFHGMEDKNLVSWNSMIAGYSQNRLPTEALNLFREMVFSGIQPYEIATTSALGACAQLSSLRLGRELHCFALKSDICKDTLVSCSLMDMYAKSGSIEECLRVFGWSDTKNIAPWTVLITAYGIHGHGREAMELFRKMQRLHFEPDGSTYLSVLMACNHAGLVEEGLGLFDEMRNSHGMEPKLEHYACVVDMLGRAGRFGDAINLVSDMPEEADARIWSSLLSSCRLHGNLDLGRKVGEKLLELEPRKPESYVLVSNLLASFGKWDDVRTVRGRMKKIGLRKDVGCSWIEVRGKTYPFHVGDRTLPHSKEVDDMWQRLQEMITKYGYVPDTSSVLHELKEEEKAEILQGHSEKLAVSFGLLKTARGTTLRIYKNLRMCRDCHNAFKLVSRAVDREIIVRDNKRFHHFKDGSCSCRDYW